MYISVDLKDTKNNESIAIVFIFIYKIESVSISLDVQFSDFIIKTILKIFTSSQNIVIKIS